MARNLDNNFIKRATRITSFNLTAADFQTLKYKNEIQSLYQQHMFGSFDPSTAISRLDKDAYNKLVRQLKKDDKEQYEKLHNLPLKGVGPAEAVFFLLTANGQLGGGSSAGVDLVMGSAKYELKAVKWKSKATKDYVADFKLGGNIPGMTTVESELQLACYENKITSVRGAPEISGSKMDELKKLDPNRYESIRKKYQELAYNYYFKSHEVVFVQTETSQPDFGEIIAIKKVKPHEIEMERYTSRSIKPLVKV